MILIELTICLLGSALAFVFPHLVARQYRRVAQRFRGFANRRTLSVIAVGVLAIVARLSVLPILPLPVPGIHDEFSYLLMADTFSHGRISNPTPPMWIHFETFHENMVPTYVSKYFPAQGAFLAIGKVLFGHPFWGVLLSSALMCAGICWMLQGWISPGWALVGGIVAVIRIGTFSYWANSYYGGAIAALAGALLLGALSRILQRPTVGNALLMGTGSVLLMTSRPYESLFLIIPVMVYLSVLVISRRSSGQRLRALPFGAVLGFVVIAGIVFIGIYFWRTTGSASRSPYSVNREQYDPRPLFPWGKFGPMPSYRHAMMQRYYLGWESTQYELARNHPIEMFVVRAVIFQGFFIGPALTIPFLGLLMALPSKPNFRLVSTETRFLVVAMTSSLIGLALPIVFNPHYAAPACCLIYFFMVAVMRYMTSWSPSSRPVGTALVAVTLAICVVMIPIRALAESAHIQLTPPQLGDWASVNPQLRSRARLSSELEKSAGQQLVIVRYGPNHDPVSEWVFNGADIEHGRVIWARDMGAEKNQELINYFKGRKVWLLLPDENPPRIEPYSFENGEAGLSNLK